MVPGLDDDVGPLAVRALELVAVGDEHDAALDVGALGQGGLDRLGGRHPVAHVDPQLGLADPEVGGEALVLDGGQDAGRDDRRHDAQGDNRQEQAVGPLEGGDHPQAVGYGEPRAEQPGASTSARAPDAPAPPSASSAPRGRSRGAGGRRPQRVDRAEAPDPAEHEPARADHDDGGEQRTGDGGQDHRDHAVRAAQVQLDRALERVGQGEGGGQPHDAADEGEQGVPGQVEQPDRGGRRADGPQRTDLSEVLLEGGQEGEAQREQDHRGEHSRHEEHRRGQDVGAHAVEQPEDRRVHHDAVGGQSRGGVGGLELGGRGARCREHLDVVLRLEVGGHGLVVLLRDDEALGGRQGGVHLGVAHEARHGEVELDRPGGHAHGVPDLRHGLGLVVDREPDLAPLRVHPVPGGVDEQVEALRGGDERRLEDRVDLGGPVDPHLGAGDGQGRHDHVVLDAGLLGGPGVDLLGQGGGVGLSGVDLDDVGRPGLGPQGLGGGQGAGDEGQSRGGQCGAHRHEDDQRDRDGGAAAQLGASQPPERVVHECPFLSSGGLVRVPPGRRALGSRLSAGPRSGPRLRRRATGRRRRAPWLPAGPLPACGRPRPGWRRGRSRRPGR